MRYMDVVSMQVLFPWVPDTVSITYFLATRACGYDLGQNGVIARVFSLRSGGLGLRNRKKLRAAQLPAPAQDPEQPGPKHKDDDERAQVGESDNLGEFQGPSCSGMYEKQAHLTDHGHDVVRRNMILCPSHHNRNVTGAFAEENISKVVPFWDYSTRLSKPNASRRSEMIVLSRTDDSHRASRPA